MIFCREQCLAACFVRVLCPITLGNYEFAREIWHKWPLWLAWQLSTGAAGGKLQRDSTPQDLAMRGSKFSISHNQQRYKFCEEERISTVSASGTLAGIPSTRKTRQTTTVKHCTQNIQDAASGYSVVRSSNPIILQGTWHHQEAAAKILSGYSAITPADIVARWLLWVDLYLRLMDHYCSTEFAPFHLQIDAPSSSLALHLVCGQYAHFARYWLRLSLSRLAHCLSSPGQPVGYCRL